MAQKELQRLLRAILRQLHGKHETVTLSAFPFSSSQAGEDTSQIEEAIQMLMVLQRKAEDRFQLSHIEGFPGDLTELGAILRHVSFIVTFLFEKTKYESLSHSN